MNALDALRHADPARRLPTQTLDSVQEHLLQEIIGTSSEHADLQDRSNSRIQRRPHRTRPDWRPILVTVTVAALLSIATFAALRSVPATNHQENPAATTTTRSGLEAALFATLPTGAQNAPSLTYSDAQPGAQGDGFNSTGRSVVLVAACDGGGTIVLTVSGSADRTLNCSTLSTLGPINLTANSNSPKGLSVGVTATSGHPQYLAKVVAIVNSTPSVSKG